MDKGLTKEHSLILYGIAILLMVAHHLFGFPERLHTGYISIGQMNGKNIETVFGIFGKLCVGLYAFISGYGLYWMFQRFKQNAYSTIWACFKDEYKLILKKMLSFFKIYWLVFAIFIPMGFVFFNYLFNIREFVFNLLGLEASYNGEWWYVKQYLKMLLWFPLLHKYFDLLPAEQNWRRKTMYALVGIIFLYKYREDYLLVFAMGYLFARNDFFIKASKLFNTYRGPWLLATNCILLCLLFWVRGIYGTMEFYIAADAFLVPCFIYVVLGFAKINVIRHVLCELGHKSVFMWLTHSFFCYYYFQELVMIPQYSLLIYLWLVLLSYGTAALLSKIHYMIFIRT